MKRPSLPRRILRRALHLPLGILGVSALAALLLVAVCVRDVDGER